MHGILHMEQNFKGEYSSQSFMCVLYWFKAFFGAGKHVCIQQSKDKTKCFSTVRNRSSCLLASLITVAYATA